MEGSAGLCRCGDEWVWRWRQIDIGMMMKGYGGKWVNLRQNPRDKTMWMEKKEVGVAWSRRWAAERVHQVAGKMKWADVLMVWVCLGGGCWRGGGGDDGGCGAEKKSLTKLREN